MAQVKEHVQQAFELINKLKAENEQLKNDLATANSHIISLEEELAASEDELSWYESPETHA